MGQPLLGLAPLLKYIRTGFELNLLLQNELSLEFDNLRQGDFLEKPRL
jgi:hypothetical protein